MCDIALSIKTKDSNKYNIMTINKIIWAVSVNSSNGFSGTGMPGSHLPEAVWLPFVNMWGQTSSLSPVSKNQNSDAGANVVVKLQ